MNESYFLSSLHLGLKHKMFGDFLQRRDRKCIVSKLFFNIMTSEWSVKGKFRKAVLFSRQHIHSSDRIRVLKNFASLFANTFKVRCAFVCDLG
jgi:hypothetical protein